MNRSRRLPLLATLLAGAATTLLAAGCGEKQEPSLSELESSTPSATAAVPERFEIEGTWKGELHQKGLKPFAVTATIADLDDPKKNTVHYTGIDCSGNWTFEGRKRETYEFRELIDAGAGKVCKGTGTVSLTPVGANQLDYVFRGGGIESQGLLERRG